MWQKILKSVLEVIIDKCYDWIAGVFADVSAKKGVKIIATKNKELIKKQDNALSEGKIDEWLKLLNQEN